ncbi:MAG: transporter substrate-binding domain-containing protein [Clostridia bacterium]|nr:transporter substrate-binding domain-containing protein [Clostridia bacterium]
MKKFLKIASIVLVIALIGVFAACGGSGDAETPEQEAKETIKIGVQTNTTGDIYSSGDFGEDAVVRYDNGALAVEALKNKKVDIVIIDNEPAKAYVAANTGLKILETEYTEEDYAICFQKGNTELKDAVDGALKELIEDGSVKKIVDKYINSGEAAEELAGVAIEAVDTDKPNLVMATNAEFPPYEYIEGDKYLGIDVEVAQIIADKLGYDLIIENVAFDSIIPGVQAGKYDMGMAGMTVTPDRLESVEFSTSYAKGIQAIIVREDSKIQAKEDLKPFYVPAE